jgi:transposase
MSDHKGARLAVNALPPVSHLIADRCYYSACFRAEFQARGIEPCIPLNRSRKNPYAHHRALYCQRHKVENLFANLKDWRRNVDLSSWCAS